MKMVGPARLELGDIRGAREALEEALPTCLEFGDRWVVPLVMAGFAGVAAGTGRPARALRLAGVARGLCAAGQFSMPTGAQARLGRWPPPARNPPCPPPGRLLPAGPRTSPPQ